MMPIDIDDLRVFSTKPSKPILIGLMGDKNTREAGKLYFENNGFPVYSDVTDTIRALAAMAEYSDYRRNLALQD